MTTDSPSMTPGHRVMTPEQIALIEKVRALGIAIEGVLNEVDMSIDDQKRLGIVEINTRIIAGEPTRWLAMARTDLQVGLMKLTRAVAQPEFF